MAEKLYPENPILIVDDDSSILESLEMALFAKGFNHLRLQNRPQEVLALLDKEDFDAVLLDVVMPEISGEDLLVKIKKRKPDLPVIMVTGVGDLKTAVSCIRKGALDYLQKPISTTELTASLQRALEIRRLRRENDRLAGKLLSDTLDHPRAFDGIITQDARMGNIFRYCEAVAHSDEPVLVTGETGTGKELIARAIHRLSGQGGEFIAVNVAGLEDHIFSDTLFGHAQGAFVGAEKNRAGFLEQASGGTLFLDEIGSLQRASQIRLLRVLQDRVYFPLGSDTPRPLTARLVAATNREVASLQNPEAFGQDFYFRIRTHHIHLPPLRDRKGDIPLLFEHFLNEAASHCRRPRPSYTSRILEALMARSFPGNIRELRALVFDAAASHQGDELSLAAFQGQTPLSAGADRRGTAPEGQVKEIFGHLDELPTLKEVNWLLIREALARSGGNQRVASGMLGITPQALSSRLRSQQG